MCRPQVYDLRIMLFQAILDCLNPFGRQGRRIWKMRSRRTRPMRHQAGTLRSLRYVTYNHVVHVASMLLDRLCAVNLTSQHPLVTGRNDAVSLTASPEEKYLTCVSAFNWKGTHDEVDGPVHRRDGRGSRRACGSTWPREDTGPEARGPSHEVPRRSIGLRQGSCATRSRYGR